MIKKGATEMKLIWDFILSRNDGTCVALHPEWKNIKFWYKEGIPVEDLEIPSTGLGGKKQGGPSSTSSGSKGLTCCNLTRQRESIPNRSRGSRSRPRMLRLLLQERPNYY